MQDGKDGENSSGAHDSNGTGTENGGTGPDKPNKQEKLRIGPLAIVIGVLVLFVLIWAFSGAGKSGRVSTSGTGYDGAALIALTSGADAKSSNVDNSISGDPGGPGGSGAGTYIENPNYNSNFNSPTRTPEKYANPDDSHAVREGSLDWMEPVLQAAEMQAMMVYNARVSAVVKDAVAAAKEVTSMITSKGGYIAGMNQSGKKDDITVRLTAKIPSKHMYAFLDSLDEVGEVITKDVMGEDVGSEYFDLKARRDSLELSYARLKDLLGKTGKLSDLLTIEQEVQRTEEQLNSVKGRMQQLEHWVAYSTVDIVLSVEPKPDVFEKPKFSWMTKTAFSGYWIGFLTFARGLWHFVLFMVAYSPLWIAIIVLAFILRGIMRTRSARGG